MKKILLLLTLMMGTLATHADDFPYLTFEMTDGTKVSVEVSSLTISISGTTLTAGGESFTLSDLSRMFFSTSDESSTPTKTANDLSFSSTTATAKIGESFTVPTLTNPYNLSLTWTSSNESVATVDQTGTVILISAGATIITATFAGSDDYEAGSVNYTLAVEKADPVANGLAFSSTTATAKIGESFTTPTLTNPYNLSLTWTSSNESVATVDQTGTVILVSAGATIITATFEGSDDYEAGSINYTLTAEPNIDVAIQSVNADNRIRIFNLAGMMQGTYDSLQKAKEILLPGIYIVYDYNKKYKVNIKK